MREPYSLGTMLSTGSLHVTDVQNSSSYSNRSLRFRRVGIDAGGVSREAGNDLFRDRPQSSLALFERRIDAARRRTSRIRESVLRAWRTFKPGGLAKWQARRTLAYIEANLGSKMGTGDLANVVALSKSHFSFPAPSSSVSDCRRWNTSS